MRPLFRKNLFILALFCFACDNTNSKNPELIISETDKKENTLKQKDSIKILDIKYIDAKSGLNYREKPKGKILGKFPYNTQVSVIMKTGVRDSVLENYEYITGEWVGIPKELDTVYVFDQFLSNSEDVSDHFSDYANYKNADSLYGNQIYQIYSRDSIVNELPLKKMITITQITPKEFKKNKPKEKLFTKNSAIKKLNDSIIRFSCNEGHSIKEFVDDNSDSESYINYSYQGTNDILQWHYVLGAAYEWSEYFLIDYNSCQTYSINGDPAIFNNFSNMITVDENYMEVLITGYTIKNKTIEKKFSFYQIYSYDKFYVTEKGEIYIKTVDFWQDANGKDLRAYQYFKYQIN